MNRSACCTGDPASGQPGAVTAGWSADIGAIDDLLVALRPSLSGLLSHWLEFEATLSTLATLRSIEVVLRLRRDLPLRRTWIEQP